MGRKITETKHDVKSGIYFPIEHQGTRKYRNVKYKTFLSRVNLFLFYEFANSKRKIFSRGQ